MMKQIVLALVILVTVVSSALATDSFDDLGNPNDPKVNERANACFDGATFEGKCDSPLMWEAGWYLIRYEAKIYKPEDIPEWLWWILPPHDVPQTSVFGKCIITISSFGSKAIVSVPGSILSGKSGYDNLVSASGFTFVWSSDGPLRAGGTIGSKYWFGNVGSDGGWSGSVDSSQCSAAPTAPKS
jgi:hypothetical protein